MARIRTIKPEFFTDGKLVKMSIHARYAFIGLFTQADREGRFEWNEDDLQMRLFIADRKVKISNILSELSENGLVARYGKNAEYGYIKNFIKHQYINPREGASVIPAPDQIDSELTKQNIGYIYAYLASTSKRVKVGMTTKLPDIRAKDLQTPEKLELVFYAKTENPKKIEAEIHRGLERYRKYGEWFEWCLEVEKTLKAYSIVLQKNDASARVGDAWSRGTQEGKGKEGNKEREEKLASEYLLNIPKEDLDQFEKRFDTTKKAIESKAEDLLLWCKQKGAFKKDYKAFLLKAIKKDFPERKEPIKIKKRVEIIDGVPTMIEG